MRHKENLPRIAMLVCFCSGVLALVNASIAYANPSTYASETSQRIIRYCDEVCELQSQDRAFSLLLEAYRQHRAFRIHRVYEARMSPTSSMAEEYGYLLINSESPGLQALRRLVMRFAEEERESSLQHLQHQVDNFRVAYQCARRADLERLNQWVQSAVDTEAAAKKLQNFVVIASGNPKQRTFQTIDPVPASTILLDVSEVIPGEFQEIQPCLED